MDVYERANRAAERTCEPRSFSSLPLNVNYEILSIECVQSMYASQGLVIRTKLVNPEDGLPISVYLPSRTMMELFKTDVEKIQSDIDSGKWLVTIRPFERVGKGEKATTKFTFNRTSRSDTPRSG